MLSEREVGILAFFCRLTNVRAAAKGCVYAKEDRTSKNHGFRGGLLCLPAQRQELGGDACEEAGHFRSLLGESGDAVQEARMSAASSARWAWLWRRKDFHMSAMYPDPSLSSPQEHVRVLEDMRTWRTCTLLSHIICCSGKIQSLKLRSYFSTLSTTLNPVLTGSVNWEFGFFLQHFALDTFLLSLLIYLSHYCYGNNQNKPRKGNISSIRNVRKKAKQFYMSTQQSVFQSTVRWWTNNSDLIHMVQTHTEKH